MGRANEVLREAGTGCVMRDSSRTAGRYEMRVLGLINDAWEESERRRLDEEEDGLVEWFVFGYVFRLSFRKSVADYFMCRDDDTWWTDQASIRELVAGYDWREDHILGGFSEAEGNYQDHGRIAYGGAGTFFSPGDYGAVTDGQDGAGILISRNLVRKMQGLGT